MRLQDHIAQDPDVMLGKLCIVGTRPTVELILDKLGHGLTYEQLMASYPVLRTEHIQAAQAFAAVVPR